MNVRKTRYIPYSRLYTNILVDVQKPNSQMAISKGTFNSPDIQNPKSSFPKCTFFTSGLNVQAAELGLSSDLQIFIWEKFSVS